MTTRFRRMAPYMVTMAALALTGWLLVTRPQPPASGRTLSGTPRLTVDRETIDLGRVPVGRMVSASFLLRNTGDGPVMFTRSPYVEAVAGC